MREMLTHLQEVDLAGWLREVWGLVERADACFVGSVVAVLVCLGHKLAAGHRHLYGWGLRAGLAAFLGYGGFALWQAGGVDRTQLLNLGARSAIVGGLALAFVWIFFPILLFFVRYFRLGLAAFLIYGGAALAASASFEEQDFLELALRGALVGLLVMLVAWILQPFLDMLAPRWWARRKDDGESPSAQAPPEPAATSRAERRRLRKEARRAARRAAQAERRAVLDDPNLLMEMRCRRDKARLVVELTYVTAEPDVRHQIPREILENWMQRYLGDHLPPEEVEENSRQLLTIFQQQQKQLQMQTGAPMTLDQLHAWFLEEQRRIQQGNVDAAVKQSQLLGLQELYVSLSQRILQEASSPIVPLTQHRQFLVEKPPPPSEEFPQVRAY